MEDGRIALSDNISDTSSTVDREHARALAVAAATAAQVSTSADDRNKSTTPSNSDHFLSAFHSNGLQPHEHEARVEALQVCSTFFWPFWLLFGSFCKSLVLFASFWQLLSAFHGSSLQPHENEARIEALYVNDK